MRKLVPYLSLIGLSLLVSVLAHGIFLREWARNRFMAGIDDGLAQMLPFKKHLYDLYTSGEFFYSTSFGLGAGTYSELSYYFSTSVVFILSAIVFYLSEVTGLIQHPDLLFWAHAAVFINIFRLAAVLVITHLVFRYMKIGNVPAFLGAAVYGLSPMYFRHAVYWEFFADAYLWLPLLVFGAEKIFREQKPGWFMFAVAISMIDNFYFAYVNFLLVAIYLFFRFFMPLEENEIQRKRALQLFLTSGLIGAGISSVSFIPAVYAFFHNHRPPFIQEIDWFDFSDNILLTSRYIVLPAVFVLLAFSVPLYRDRKFRFFAVLAVIGILLHYSPMAASIFNGFGAPRFRWEHFISFAAGALIAYGLSHLSLLKIRHLLWAGMSAVLVYGFYFVRDPSIENRPIPAAGTGIALLVTLFLLIWVKNERKRLKQAAAGIIVMLILFTNSYLQVMLTEAGEVKNVTEEYITSYRYDDPEIRRLLGQIEDREGDSFYRVDWMEGVRNNIPLVQDFRGVSAYSSILNGELLHFYLYELKIDMGRESISRYATLGRRANLHSLLKADYVILNKENPNAPYGFDQVFSSEHFAVYENRHELPFVRGVSTVFSEEQLEEDTVLRREHAMLSGVVLKDPASTASLPPAPEEVSFSVQAANGSFQDGNLTVTEETGGVDLVLEEPVSSESDLYVSFHLLNPVPGDGYPMTVNSYRTSRKPNNSLYRTYVDDVTIRVPANERIEIRMPTGTYKLTELAVYEEPYQVLRSSSTEESESGEVEWDGSLLKAKYNNNNGADYLTLPVPYEKGWHAEVNGKETKILEANYAFIAVPAEQGHNTIELTYRPPYFASSLGVSLISVVLGILYLRRDRRVRPLVPFV